MVADARRVDKRWILEDLERDIYVSIDDLMLNTQLVNGKTQEQTENLLLKIIERSSNQKELFDAVFCMAPNPAWMDELIKAY